MEIEHAQPEMQSGYFRKKKKNYFVGVVCLIKEKEK